MASQSLEDDGKGRPLSKSTRLWRRRAAPCGRLFGELQLLSSGFRSKYRTLPISLGFRQLDRFRSIDMRSQQATRLAVTAFACSRRCRHVADSQTCLYYFLQSSHQSRHCDHAWRCCLGSLDCYNVRHASAGKPFLHHPTAMGRVFMSLLTAHLVPECCRHLADIPNPV
jgi:hypothetical protein